MRSSCTRISRSVPIFSLFFLFSFSPLAGQDTAPETVSGERSGEAHSGGVEDTLSFPGTEVAEEYPEVELTALKDMTGARRWWNAWLAGYSAATAGQAAVFFSSDDKTLRQDMVLGAATTFLGAMNQLITPVEPERGDYPSQREYLSGEKSLSADQAAELLKTLAAWEKKGRSWKTHAIAGAVNVGSGLITWLGFDRTFLDGLQNFAINTLITEAQIWTQPIRAARDYENYCRKTGVNGETRPSSPEGEWTWSIHPGGFYVRYVF
jgi:hypothetical protein